MADALKITGLKSRQGETAAAFCFVRLETEAGREALARIVRGLAPLLDVDIDEFIASIPDELDARLLVALPWAPPSADELAEQEATLRSIAVSEQIAQAWFFQVGTSAVDEDDEDDDDDDDEDEDDDDEDDGDEDDDDESKAWTSGLPPQLTSEPPFPVDGYPEIIEEFDWYDFGIAVKLAKPSVAGEFDVLHAFHALWLAPIAGHFRNTDVTVDRTHRAVHFWADRFTAPLSAEQTVGNLLWVVDCLRQVVPVIHATFQPATMAQKYGGLMGDTSEPFILAGNPITAVQSDGGIDATLAWIDSQTDWSPEEIARMLQQTAIDSLSEDDEGNPTAESAATACHLLEKALELSPEDDEVQYTYGRVLLAAGRADDLVGKLAGFDVGTRLQLVNVLGSEAPDAFAGGLDAVLGDELPDQVLGSTSTSCGSGATISSFGDQSAELLGALTVHAAALAPDRLGQLAGQLPDDIDTLAVVAYQLGQAGHSATALELGQRIVDLPPPPLGTSERANYCRTINNICIQAHGAKDYPLAVSIADKAQPYGYENPFIYHSAACAYAAVGDFDRALAQVELAASHDYPNLAPDTGSEASSFIETDSDLGELLEWPQFKDLFARWREARPAFVKGSEALAEGDAAEAVAALGDACSESSPLARKALINLGLAHGELGDYDKMWELSLSSLQRFPEDPDLLANLIYAARERGQLGDAVDVVLEVYNKQRGEARTIQNITYVLNEAERYSDSLDAIAWWTENHGPLPALAMNNAANASLKTGNVAGGVDWARKNVAADDSANAQWMLSFALMLAGDLDGALDAARECREWDEDVFEELAADPDMAPVVTDPRFADLRTD